MDTLPAPQIDGIMLSHLQEMLEPHQHVYKAPSGCLYSMKSGDILIPAVDDFDMLLPTQDLKIYPVYTPKVCVWQLSGVTVLKGTDTQLEMSQNDGKYDMAIFRGGDSQVPVVELLGESGYLIQFPVLPCAQIKKERDGKRVRITTLVDGFWRSVFLRKMGCADEIHQILLDARDEACRPGSNDLNHSPEVPTDTASRERAVSSTATVLSSPSTAYEAGDHHHAHVPDASPRTSSQISHTVHVPDVESIQQALVSDGNQFILGYYKQMGQDGQQAYVRSVSESLISTERTSSASMSTIDDETVMMAKDLTWKVESLKFTLSTLKNENQRLLSKLQLFEEENARLNRENEKLILCSAKKPSITRKKVATQRVPQM
ncbi:hypothetical protein BJ742DRAFT_903129 [Cladochytrium replicatum]|nr:hypothetical protein BJ742DRAFT_903129 [Cladochytrium replicatum]